jgi:U3 small nucleolar RNA-associated protein 22
VVQAAKLSALRKDVLIGFDALGPVLLQLDARLGHCAVFCVDKLGGSVIGIKWKPKGWLPGPFRVATAHTSRPCVAGELGNNGLFITDIATVMQEILDIGQGMIADMLLCC